MRIALVGATGNAGTAVLRALHRHPEITEVIGIARRLPDQELEPYDRCEWASIDIAAASTEADAVAELTEAFRGCDAVIHLAWMVQPNDRRELLRRVNVEGTRRVARAVAQAGVDHLVVASSVGAYSPDEARETLRKDGTEPPLRDETFPTQGIETSHYSVDKAAQEDVLDEFGSQHPEITLSRLRPGLLFQGDAASEIQRYFLGKSVPPKLLAPGTLPSLPLPSGLRLQALHTDDVGDAYVAAVLAKKSGAFNVCADDVLGPRELADILSTSGKYVEIPPGIVRAALLATHKAGVVPADVGWLDMGMQVPLMDNSKAKRELGWSPRHTAAAALRELLEGMAQGRGHVSPPLRPRNSAEKNVDALHEPVSAGAAAGGDTGVTAGETAGTADALSGAPQDGSKNQHTRQTTGNTQIPEAMSSDLLELYLSDHLTGATAGANRIARMAADFVDTPVFAQLGQLADQISAERDFLEQIINDLGLKQKPYRQAAAWVGERVGRLKGNGKVVERSPMTMLLETELMRGAVNAKIGGWETLREHAATLGLDRAVFDAMIENSYQQVELLEEVHAYARPRALRDDEDIYWD